MHLILANIYFIHEKLKLKFMYILTYYSILFWCVCVPFEMKKAKHEHQERGVVVIFT